MSEAMPTNTPTSAKAANRTRFTGNPQQATAGLCETLNVGGTPTAPDEPAPSAGGGVVDVAPADTVKPLPPGGSIKDRPALNIIRQAEKQFAENNYRIVQGSRSAVPMVTLTLNYDHALCDGVYAASFLAAIVKDLEA